MPADRATSTATTGARTTPVGVISLNSVARTLTLSDGSITVVPSAETASIARPILGTASQSNTELVGTRVANTAFGTAAAIPTRSTSNAGRSHRPSGNSIALLAGVLCAAYGL